MHRNLRPARHASILISLVFLVSQAAWSQKASKDRPQTPASDRALVDKRGTPKPGSADNRPTDTLLQGSDADQQPDRAELDREMLHLRQQLEREALNRMRFGRTDRFHELMSFLVPFFVFLVLTAAVLWILRVVLENRRWNKVVRVQSETHAKLLEKFASSQDMIAYMESEAGRRFLESPAFQIQPAQSAAFPFGRILWSLQVGIVVAIVGVGLLFLRGRVPEEGDTALLVFGTLGLTLGIGFLLSAAVSYGISRHMGLLERPKATLSSSETNASRS